MMRRPIIAGNWKMHTTLAEAQALARALTSACETDAVDVVVCPPYTALALVRDALRGSAIGLGAQDMFWETKGSFTGEISSIMLRDAGCTFVIIGHSERRTHFGETDAMVHHKLSAVLSNGLTPIVCIGETLAERDAGKTFDVLTRQLGAVFAGCESWSCDRVVLAYEPVWAIGTGKTAAPEQAQEVHQFIRQWITKRCGRTVGEAIRLQYGGSVTPENAAALLQQADVDGALVGGASLKGPSFAAIVGAAVQVSAGAGKVER